MRGSLHASCGNYLRINTDRERWRSARASLALVSCTAAPRRVVPGFFSTSEYAAGSYEQRTWASGQDSRRASAGTAPSSRIAWRLAISRDRFCSAPAAEPHALHAGALHRYPRVRLRRVSGMLQDEG